MHLSSRTPFLYARCMMNWFTNLTDSGKRSRARATPTADTKSQSLVNSSALPTLLWEMIIDSLADEDLYQFWVPGALKSLRACSLTCRAWTPRSRYHLFRFVSVSCSTRGKKNGERLVALLNKYRDLHSNVQTLVVRDGKNSESILKTLPAQLGALLPQLPTLRLYELSLEIPPGDAFEISLRQFASITTLDLYAVTVDSLRDLQLTVSTIHGLQKLVLADMRWRERSIIDSQIPVAPSHVRLQTLEVYGNNYWVWDSRTALFSEWLALSGIVASLKLAALNRLPITHDAMLLAVETMIQASDTSLETLELHFGPSVDFVRCEYLSVSLDTNIFTEESMLSELNIVEV